MKTACILDKYDEAHVGKIPLNSVELEHIFIKHRLYEELIVFRAKGDGYSGIDYKLVAQKLIHVGNSFYDHLVVSITAFHKKDFNHLKEIYEGPNGASNPSFDIDEHHALHNSLMCGSQREYWFDITTFFETECKDNSKRVTTNLWTKIIEQVRRMRRL